MNSPRGLGPNSCLGWCGQMSELLQVPLAAEVAPACAGPWNGGNIGQIVGMKKDKG